MASTTGRATLSPTRSAANLNIKKLFFVSIIMNMWYVNIRFYNRRMCGIPTYFILYYVLCLFNISKCLWSVLILLWSKTQWAVPYLVAQLVRVELLLVSHWALMCRATGAWSLTLRHRGDQPLVGLTRISSTTTTWIISSIEHPDINTQPTIIDTTTMASIKTSIVR